MSTDAPGPEEYSRALLAKLNMSQPIDMAALAEACGLRLREVKSTGFDGALVQVPGVEGGIVAIREGIEERRKRFTIAHEIGHYVLHGHGLERQACKEAEIEAWSDEASNQERDANLFASELLLPLEEIEPIVRQKGTSLETARFISEKFETSLTAAALRCVEASDDTCALVVSFDGVVSWFKGNNFWKYFISVHCALGPGTLAKQLFSGGKGQKSGIVSAMAWTGSGKMLPDAEIVEDSLLLPRYKTVLSLLIAVGP